MAAIKEDSDRLPEGGTESDLAVGLGAGDKKVEGMAPVPLPGKLGA